MRSLTALALALAGVTAGGAAAAPITVSFTGTITFVPMQISSGPFESGDAISGSFQLEAATPDLDPAPTEGEYQGAVSNLSFTFGGYSGTGTGENQLHMRDGAGNVVDNFFVQSDFSGADVAGFPPFHFLFDLGDAENTIFSSDAIPTSLDLADFEVRNLILGFEDGSSIYNVNGTITSVTYAVPEPALLGLAGLVLAAARARRNR